MKTESTKEIYSSMKNVWPVQSNWYDYTHRTIIQFVENNLFSKLNSKSIYLNAGSGGSIYNLPGTCYHVDIAENLIQSLPHHYVASIEKLPFADSTFNSVICVGSVLNYCSAIESITELSRVLKAGGYLILEFERSNTAELWFTKDYGKNATIQEYEYLNHVHTLWLYAEQDIRKLLSYNKINIIKYKRFHNLSALVNRISQNEEISGDFSKYDIFFNPISYLMAHNIILLCSKEE